jgi:O-antigen/teichoic acid export membrane protein
VIRDVRHACAHLSVTESTLDLRSGASSAAPVVNSLARRRDYLVTFATEFLTLGSTLAAFKLAALHSGTEGFGEYVLARRTLSLLQLPILCGMGVAVTRYVARSRAEGDPITEARYFAAGLTVSITLAALGATILNVVPAAWSGVLFGVERHGNLVRSISVAIAGLAIHGVAYGALRGRVDMVRANLLQGVNLAMVPLAVLSVPGLSAGQVVATTGLLWGAVAAVAAWALLRDAPPGVWGWAGLQPAIRVLLRFGAPRVPGEFALGALFTLPATVAAHGHGIAIGGFTALGVSVVTMIGSAFAPLGQLVLPTVSAAASRGESAGLRRAAQVLLFRCLLLALVGAVGVEILAPAIPWALGTEFGPAIAMVRIMVIGAVPYVAYIVLRNVLDALHTAPLNAKNLMVGLAVFLTGGLLAREPLGIGAAFAASLWVLGGLSMRDAERAFLHAAGKSPARSRP